MRGEGGCENGRISGGFSGSRRARGARPTKQRTWATHPAVGGYALPPGLAVIAALTLALVAAAAGFWWICARDPSIAFLPARAGAEWIVYPSRAETETHDTVAITAQFRHSFTLTALPTEATLTVCAFRAGAVAINGRKLDNLPCLDRNWKLPSRVQVAGLLQPGTNEITAWVTNSLGPPALWLRLNSVRLSLGTSHRWQVSINGTDWHDSRLAAQPLEFHPDSSIYGSLQVVDLVKSAWPVEAAFCAVALGLIWGVGRWLRHKRLPDGTLPPPISTKLSYGLLALVLIARAALLINNLPQLPRFMGFDAEDHEQYIQFIQQKHALPLADQGWQMFQPPLYYLASALVLAGCGESVENEEAGYYLRAVNGVIGLLHCWVAFLCLRLLFRRNLPALAAGLLIAAFLPPSLYLSQYVTNEPLTGLLVTTAIYLCLRALRADKDGLGLPIGIGVALGAAMLTKFSVLLALPFFPAALSQRLAARKEHAGRAWLRSVGLIMVACVVICGWHYGRVWARFGKFNVWNWDPQAKQNYWQDPGFRTGAYYSTFGRSLVSPWFSSFHSFADGVYSTLWGDGLGSGMGDPVCQPPWNYELMGAGYWISLGICLLVIIGGALVLAKIMHQPYGQWLLVFGPVCIYSLGLVWMNLVLPSYPQAKAYYAFPALLSFSAMAAVGWDWLRQQRRALGTTAWVLVLVWAMTVYASFWIRSGNPVAHWVKTLEKGSTALRQGKLDDAILQYQEAVRLKPDCAAACYNLGNALGRNSQTDEAIRQLQQAIRLKPDYARAYNDLGIAYATKGDVGEAIRQYQQAMRLQPDDAEAHFNLGVTLTGNGQTDEAIRQYQEALRLKPDYVLALNNLGIALAGKGQIDDAINQFRQALRFKPDYADARRNLDIALALKARSGQPQADTDKHQ